METSINSSPASPDQELPNEEDEHQALLDNSDSTRTQQKHQKMLPTRCNGCTVVIEPVLFFFMLTQSPDYLLMPQYFQRKEWERLMGNETYPTSSNACQPELNSTHTDYITGNLTLAGSAASIFGLKMSLASSLPAIFSVMFLGPYSDKAGRKYALVIPIIGQLIGSLINFVDMYFHLPLELLLLGAFIYGCCGTQTTFFMAGVSYIIDIVPEASRSFRMVFAEVLITLPYIVAAAGSGFWVDVLGFTWVFLGMFICNVFILVYIVVLIPETIRRDPAVTVFSSCHIKKAITVFAVDDSSRRRWKLLILISAFFICRIAGSSNIDTYFTQNAPLCWGSVLIGVFSAARFSVSSVGSAASIKLLSPYLRDAWLTVVAASGLTLSCVFKFFVTTTKMMFASTVLNLVDLAYTPTLKSMVSKLVQPDEIGAVLSGVAVLDVVALLVGSAVINPMYSATERAGHPNQVYLLVAGIWLCSELIMIVFALLTKEGGRHRKRAVE